MSPYCRQGQCGSVIIIALWTIILMTILVAVIASQTRLSADVVYMNKQELTVWANEESAVNRAEMEVMMELMPRPVTNGTSLVIDNSAASLNAALKNPRYRYNGQPLKLAYPQADNMEVRIYDHAGKINLRQITRAKWRSIIEKKLGGSSKADPDQLNQLMDAWNDWLDLNDGKSPNGAEKDYYQALPLPYTPRNGQLETVEEILGIKGFASVFGDVDLDAAFTLYGDDELINLNTATVEAMRLLPGLDDGLIGKIVAYRQKNEFQGNGDVATVLPAEAMIELRPYINSRKTTNYYTIMVSPKAAAKPEDLQKNDQQKDDKDATNDNDNSPPLTAYAETVFVPSPTERPQVLKINPYEKVPLSPDSLVKQGDTNQ